MCSMKYELPLVRLTVISGEATSHALLSEHNLAPQLLARFQNGLMYKFIRGRVCQPQDLRMEPVWKAVAHTLAQWHATLPIISEQATSTADHKTQNDQISRSPPQSMPSLAKINAITPTKSSPNIWTVMQKWVFALPVRSDEEKRHQAQLQRELERTVAELSNLPGLGKDGVCSSLASYWVSADSVVSLFWVIVTSFPAML